MPSHSDTTDLDRGLLIGVTVFRTAAWVWMAITLAIEVSNNSDTNLSVAHPAVGFALVAGAFAYAVFNAATVVQNPYRVLSWPVVALDIALAALLLFADPWVFQSAHSQRLGNNWSIATVLQTGLAFGGRAGGASGAVLGVARAGGIGLWETPGGWEGDQILAAVSAVMIFTLGGSVTGYAAVRVRDAERELALSRATASVARTLHDGVLQTLAVIQRRSGDAELVEMARQQEQDLRLFLFGARPDRATDLRTRLRAAAAEHERMHRDRVAVVCAGDLGPVPDHIGDAVIGAVTEGLTNAAKHGQARNITVFLEGGEDDELFVSVKDDGRGFEPELVSEGIGLTESIRGRICEVGGSVVVTSAPGRGTELQLRLPWIS